MTKQTLLEKADILFGTINESSEPLSSLSLLDICLKWYTQIRKAALENKNTEEFFYCEEKIEKVAKLRNKIIYSLYNL